MRNVLLVGLMLMLVGVASAGGVSGQDSGPDHAETPFAAHTATSPSVDGETWTLTVTMDQDAVDNGTTLLLTTQICTNDGVCDPPVTQEATVSDDGGSHTITVTPPEDHTYVNWRAKVTYSDGEDEFYPLGDWYKTWSNCYYDDGAWGGEGATADGCVEEEESPGPGFVLSLVALTVAAAAVARRSGNA
ncbi:MAG: hypothetical protein CBD01_006865 [Euryarchaeota archaeon TMED141]|nr:MAG: hypothetical protein CBD01_006865 [Euryarchaeota archaeon TMED141]DAC09266.1 MAG TPA: hypothetical protein D7I09_06360 [Candidatus Poseidoniales archaeon]HII18934.1 hypothetical protein [Candidatus Poseidoniaceae archaeon]|tara:strand:- start:613 stop:1179 length:567 start_codon:yes stop_codon:yes gene_type:complete